MKGAYDLARFVDAQADSYDGALAELRAGVKRSHWMWFIFPQLAGLGRSAMAAHYAIGSLDEASAYLAHPFLGVHYLECVAALESLHDTSAERVFGAIDAVKLRSSLTLFAASTPEPFVARALARWFGREDEATLALLSTRAPCVVPTVGAPQHRPRTDL